MHGLPFNFLDSRVEHFFFFGFFFGSPATSFLFFFFFLSVSFFLSLFLSLSLSSHFYQTPDALFPLLISKQLKKKNQEKKKRTKIC